MKTFRLVLFSVAGLALIIVCFGFARHRSNKAIAMARAARECGQTLARANSYELHDRVENAEFLQFSLFDGRYKVAHKVWATHRYFDQWRRVAPGAIIILEFHPGGEDDNHPYEPESYEVPRTP